jgi:hypothetical protein
LNTIFIKEQKTIDLITTCIVAILHDYKICAHLVVVANIVQSINLFLECAHVVIRFFSRFYVKTKEVEIILRAEIEKNCVLHTLKCCYVYLKNIGTNSHSTWPIFTYHCHEQTP